MKWIKLHRDCALGKKGTVVQVVEHLAKQRILDNQATEVDAPKRHRIKPDNKALSAAR